jgi:diadenosine tetraphosphate (Ap4A) HIT family hydrolase
MTACVLCGTDGGLLVRRAPHWRLIRATDTPAYPAFYRVVWNAHVAELSDLSDAERHECMDVVTQVERLMRDHLAPAKINLAALGNMVPHLHWHLIARFEGDSHFPAPIWAPAQREPAPHVLAALTSKLPALDHALATAFH